MVVPQNSPHFTSQLLAVYTRAILLTNSTMSFPPNQAWPRMFLSLLDRLDVMQTKFAMLQGELAVVHEKLAMVQKKLAMVQEEPAMVQAELTMVQADLAMVGDRLSAVELGQGPAAPDLHAPVKADARDYGTPGVPLPDHGHEQDWDMDLS